MLELDAWLTTFFERHYAELPADRQRAFAKLLEQDDMQLFDWLTAAAEPPPDLQPIVNLMRQSKDE